MIMARMAPAGKVITQEIKIVLITLRFIAAIPLAKPTPRTAPTRVCVVDIGIPVPDADADVMSPDLLLVPILAFDRHGFRLGYGGGFYDRTIARLRETQGILTVGLAFSGQVRDDLPVGPHDMRLDWIVTESAALRVSG